MNIDPVLLAMLVPIVAALVQAAKKIPAIGTCPALLPWVSIGFGVGAAAVHAFLIVGAGLSGVAIGNVLVNGVAAGLTAAGLYSAGGKVALQKVSDLGTAIFSLLKK